MFNRMLELPMPIILYVLKISILILFDQRFYEFSVNDSFKVVLDEPSFTKCLYPPLN